MLNATARLRLRRGVYSATSEATDGRPCRSGGPSRCEGRRAARGFGAQGGSSVVHADDRWRCAERGLATDPVAEVPPRLRRFPSRRSRGRVPPELADRFVGEIPKVSAIAGSTGQRLDVVAVDDDGHRCNRITILHAGRRHVVDLVHDVDRDSSSPAATSCVCSFGSLPIVGPLSPLVRMVGPSVRSRRPSTRPRNGVGHCPRVNGHLQVEQKLHGADASSMTSCCLTMLSRRIRSGCCYNQNAAIRQRRPRPASPATPTMPGGINARTEFRGGHRP